MYDGCSLITRRCHRADPSPIASRRRSLSTKGKFRTNPVAEIRIATNFTGILTWNIELRVEKVRFWRRGARVRARARCACAVRAERPRGSGVHATNETKSSIRAFLFDRIFFSAPKNELFLDAFPF